MLSVEMSQWRQVLIQVLCNVVLPAAFIFILSKRPGKNTSKQAQMEQQKNLDKIKQLEQDIQDLLQKNKLQRDQNQKKDSQLGDLQNKITTLERMNGQHDQLQTKLQTKLAKALDDLDLKEIQLTELSQQLNAKAKQCEDLDKDLKQTQGDKENLSKQLEEERKLNATKTTKQVQTLNAELQKLRSSNQQLTEENQKTQKQNASLQSSVDAKKAQLTDLQSNVADLKKQAQDMENRYGKEKTAREKLQNDVNQQKAELERMISEAEQRDTQMKSLCEENEKKQKENKELQQQLKEQQQKQELQEKELKEQISTGESQLYQTNEELAQLKKTMSQLENQAEGQQDLHLKLAQLESVSASLKKELESKSQSLAQTEQEVESFKKNLETAKANNRELGESLHYLGEEKDTLAKLHSAVDAENVELKARLVQLDQEASQSQSLKQENESLKSKIGMNEAQLKDLVNRAFSEEELQKIKSRNQQLQEEIERLKKANEENAKKASEYDELWEGRQQDMSAIRQLERQLEELMHQQNMKEPETEEPDSAADTSGVDAVPAQEGSPEAHQDSDNDVNELEETSGPNPLLKGLEKYKKEKPMHYASIFKLLEELLDKKYESDKADLEARIQPRPTAPFFLDLMLTKYGVKTIAQKEIAKLIMGINGLNEQNAEYAVFFGRLIHLFKPIDLICTTFLVQISQDFERLVELSNKLKSSKEASQKPRGSTFGRDQFEAAMCGGEAPLVDIFDLIDQEFAQDRKTGNNIIMRQQPTDKTRNEYILFVVAWKISKIGKQPADVFDMLDEDKSGTIEPEELGKGLKRYLGIKLNKEELATFLEYLDEDKSGVIDRFEFVDKVCLISSKIRKKNSWLGNKARFLMSVVEEYDEKKHRDYEKLQKIFLDSDDNGDGVLELFEFEALIQKIDPSTSRQKILSLFQKALSRSHSENPDAMNPLGFASTLFLHNVGGYGTGIFKGDVILSSAARIEGSDLGGKGKSKFAKTVQTRKKVAAFSKKK